MTKKQREKAIKLFQGELLYKGWKLDRWGNYISGSYRVKITPQTWRYERKVDGQWTKLQAHPLNQLSEGCAPHPEPKDRPTQPKADKPLKGLPQGTDLDAKPEIALLSKPVKASRKGQVTKQESERSSEPLKVKVSLDEMSQKRIDAMAFKQVQTHSRMDLLEKTVAQLTTVVESMAGMVQSELHRIKSRPAVEVTPLFCHKLFHKISFKLRKKSIDVLVEDIHQGVKRKRVFRCSDWTRVEHLVAYRTLTDGIEELELKPVIRRKKAGKGQSKKQSPKKPAKKRTVSEVREEMEREGIPNAIIPERKSRYFREEADKQQRAINRSREKAEKVITKICSPGGVAEGAQDAELIEALHANGFDREVAFYAASNCGRITDPAVIRKYKPKAGSKPGATSNEY